MGHFWIKRQHDPDTFLPPNSIKKALEVGPKMQEMARIAYQNGVTIAFGTDTGVSKHGENAKEFEYMMVAGMRNLQTLSELAATR